LHSLIKSKQKIYNGPIFAKAAGEKSSKKLDKLDELMRKMQQLIEVVKQATG